MATYPSGPFTLNGGCNCGAIRYKLDCPAESNRTIALTADKSNGQGNICFPQTAVCFCNDCRRGSGALVLFAMMCPIDQTSFSLLRKSTSNERLESPASTYFADPAPLPVGHSSSVDDTYFSMYQSSKKALRGFCAKCGTPFMYVYTPRPLPAGVSTGGMDVYLGTVDRDDLEILRGLDHFVHCDSGIEWVKKLFVKEESGDRRSRWHDGSSMAEWF